MISSGFIGGNKGRGIECPGKVGSPSFSICTGINRYPFESWYKSIHVPPLMAQLRMISQWIYFKNVWAWSQNGPVFRYHIMAVKYQILCGTPSRLHWNTHTRRSAWRWWTSHQISPWWLSFPHRFIGSGKIDNQAPCNCMGLWIMYPEPIYPRRSHSLPVSCLMVLPATETGYMRSERISSRQTPNMVSLFPPAAKCLTS